MASLWQSDVILPGLNKKRENISCRSGTEKNSVGDGDGTEFEPSVEGKAAVDRRSTVLTSPANRSM